MTALVLDQPFFATLALRLKIEMSDQFPTFATDGVTLAVNPEFCATLTDAQIQTVLCHEVLHCALGHTWRTPMESDPERWNKSCDQEVNDILLSDENMSIPDGYYHRADHAGWAAERVYGALMAEPKQDNSGQGNGDGDQQGNNPGMGEVLPAPGGKSGAQQQREEWERALVQAAKIAEGRGKLPGALKRLAGELCNPRRDWRQVLHDYLRDLAHDDWSWMQPSRRYPDNDFIMPSLNSEGSGYVIFAVDTSGSIDPLAFEQFISEAQTCLDELSPSKLTVICCDADIQSVTEYQPGDIISREAPGGGGTDFRPVFEHVKQSEDVPAVMVFLTDLDGDFPHDAPEYPVIWVTNNDGKTAPFGETIAI